MSHNKIEIYVFAWDYIKSTAKYFDIKTHLCFYLHLQISNFLELNHVYFQDDVEEIMSMSKANYDCYFVPLKANR